REIAARERAENPFAASAITTAIEMPRYLAAARGSYPLNAPISGEIPVDQFRTDVLRALDNGFQFIKVKVGNALAANIETARAILNGFSDRNFQVIFDANQGFSFEDALAFAR